MKKIGKFLLGLSLLAALLTGCTTNTNNGDNQGGSGSDPVSTHHFESAWTNDETNHWHKCSDEGCTEVSDKAAHNFEIEVIEPTETEDGYTLYTCSVCNYSYQSDVTPAIGHVHSFESTWSHDETYHWHKCSDEGCTEVSDKAAHNFTSTVVEPTTAQGGYTTYTCTVCDYSYQDDFTDPIEEEEGIKVTSYTFTDKNWSSDNGKWTASSNGGNFSNGVQVTSSLSGVSVTSPKSFTSVLSVDVTYHTNSSRGKGAISVYVGSELVSKQSVTKDGGTTNRKLHYEVSGGLTGNVKLVVECNENSIYIAKVEIENGKLTPVDPTSISLNESDFELVAGKTKQLSVKYSPSNANQNLDISWSSDNESVATVDSKGLVTAKETAVTGASANITATLNFNNSTASVKVTIVEQKKDTYTVLLYLCGSDLESGWDGEQTNVREAGLATEDIKEILSVKNQPDDINIVIETGGAKAWSTKYGVNNKKLQRHHVENGQLVTDEELNNASMGKASTLQSFLEYGLENYPAEKTALILWNHGGALGGVCFDENYSGDSLLASEVASAIEGAYDTVGLTVGVDKLEWIGYDACLMAVQDIAEINSKYFNYMIASEESEAGEGWEYSTWVDDLYAYKDTNTILKAICDGFIASYEEKYGSQGYMNDQTLSYYDLSKMADYKEAFESLASNMASTIKNNASSFNSTIKSAKAYGDSYLEKEEYQLYLQSGYTSDMFDKIVEDGQTYYLLHGYYDFATFDVKDALTKIKANSKFGSYASEINNVLNLLDQVVVYSECGDDAGESYGLCLVCPVDSYTEKLYSASETHFNNWRSAVLARSY